MFTQGVGAMLRDSAGFAQPTPLLTTLVGLGLIIFGFLWRSLRRNFPSFTVSLGNVARSQKTWFVVAALVWLNLLNSIHTMRYEMDAYLLPRKLTEQQMSDMRSTLGTHKPTVPVTVVYSMADQEASEYGSQIAQVMRSSGWIVRSQGVNPWEIGPNVSHGNGTFHNLDLANSVGIQVRVGLPGQPKYSDQEPPTTEEVLQQAFNKARIEAGGGSAADKGQYFVFVVVGRRPVALFNPSWTSRLQHWIIQRIMMIRAQNQFSSPDGQSAVTRT